MKSNKYYGIWLCLCSPSYPAHNMHNAVLYCYLWLIRLYHISPRYLINGTIFCKKVIKHKICFDFFYKFFRTHFSFNEEFSEILSQIYLGLHVEYPLFLSGFNDTWISSTDFRKTLKYQISRKSVQWEPSCSMRTWQPDRKDETNSRFS